MKGRRLALFLELHNPGASDLRPFFFTSAPDVLGKLAQQNQTAFLALAAQRIDGPLALEPRPRFTGPKYHPLWRQISNAWVSQHGNPHTIALCLETSWNTPHSTTDGYRAVGRQLGQAVADYLRRER